MPRTDRIVIPLCTSKREPSWATSVAMACGSIDKIEAAHDPVEDEEAWLRGIAQSMGPSDQGVIAYSYRITTAGTVAIDTFAGVGVDKLAETRQVTTAAVTSMPASYVQETWATLSCATALRAGSPETRAQTRAAMAHWYGGFGLQDISVVNGIDPSGHGIYIGAFSSQELE